MIPRRRLPTPRPDTRQAQPGAADRRPQQATGSARLLLMRVCQQASNGTQLDGQ